MIATTLQESVEFIEDRFHISPNEVKGPFFHKEQEWKKHCNRYKIDPKKSGVFYPHLMEAHVPTSATDFAARAIHEYLGHGLFYQHTPFGHFIRKKEQEITDGISNNFRITPDQEKAIEGFAVWMEKYVLQGIGKENLWEERNKKLQPWYQDTLKEVEKEEIWGEYGVLYGAGLPKHYTPQDLVKMCKSFFKEEFEKVQFIVLYGSRKPLSDIDLCVIGDFTSKVVYKGWLDMKIKNKEEFFSELAYFDLLAVSTLLTGTTIFGDIACIEQQKRSARETPITHAAINYNLLRSQQTAEFIRTGDYHNLQGTVETFYASQWHAEELAQGRKWLGIEEVRKARPELEKMVKETITRIQ